MPTLLIVVSDRFELDGRIALAPPVPFSIIDGEELKPGANLELKCPNGTTFKTELYSFEWPTPSVGGLCISLGKPFTKANVPLGTEVWKIT
jgi:hypothetical protein